MTDYWCEYAWLGGSDVDQGVLLEIAGDRIETVTAEVDAPPDAIRLAGLTLPALANAHSHAFHRTLRGRTHAKHGSFWSWRDLMYEVAAKLDPDNYLRLARAVFAEMARAGIGVVGEFHYVHHGVDGAPYEDANAMGLAIVEAAGDVGIRLTLLDALYLHGGFSDDAGGGAVAGYAPLSTHQARFGDGTAEQWTDRVGDLRTKVQSPLVVVGAAIHSVRAVDPASISVAAEWATANGAPLHAHVSEQPAENEQCAAAHGRTPTEVLADSGALVPTTTLVHCIHSTAGDIAAMASTGTRCCVCPTTERDLADGIAPDLANSGVEVCLGSDSHAVIDLFEEARAVELNQRLAQLERGVHTPADLAAMATANGYQALGWSDGGTLTPGALADFTTVAFDGVNLAGTTCGSALAASVFAASAADVSHLVVGGRPVVVDGHHVAIDAATELGSTISEILAP